MIDQVAPFSVSELKYLNLLSENYPTINSVASTIINLKAILHLPKGTEHFVSDVHGEDEAFSHVLRNASGVIKTHIDVLFGSSMREQEKKALATLIYYPEEKLEHIMRTEANMDDWYWVTLHRLITMCKHVSSRYTRSKVRKALPAEFAYILEELLHVNTNETAKALYYNEIIRSIIDVDSAKRFVIVLSDLIQRFSIDRLHVIGDIYDRGPNAAKIMDILEKYHSVDIQWGNHDLAWMGAASGCTALICNVLRIQTRYANHITIEEDYGINLIPLVTFAMETYADDDCAQFMPITTQGFLNEKDEKLIAKMHKAIAIIQWKLEATIIKRNPDFHMNDRLLLDKINKEAGTICIDGVDYPMKDTNFPTINPEDPFALSPEESSMMDKIRFSFLHSEKLQQHMKVLYRKGGMYKIYNSNLLFHGGIPLNEDGTLKKVFFRGKKLSGKSLFDEIDRTVREAYFGKAHSAERRECLDLVWYLWCGEDSPVFCKKKMTTFERYFVADKAVHVELRNPYYSMRNDETVCERILADFSLDPVLSRMVNGHVPVKVSKGENPIKANGKLFVIDGGFAKAYQKVTGIAGYTLIYNSHGLLLVSHEPFESKDEAISKERDVLSSKVASQYSQERIRVKDTDDGVDIQAQIDELEKLLFAYHTGLLKER